MEERRMKDFGKVGKRLRQSRISAIFFAGLGIVLSVSGIARYWDHGPPSRYVEVWQDRYTLDRNASHYEAIPRDDPSYLDIVRGRESELMYFLLWGSGFTAVGALFYWRSRKLPGKEILLLAESRGGLLTLPEVSTTLDIDPGLAASALKELQKLHIACPRWQELRKNLWEFPDYMTLPIAESVTTPIFLILLW